MSEPVRAWIAESGALKPVGTEAKNGRLVLDGEPVLDLLEAWLSFGKSKRVPTEALLREHGRPK